MEKLGLNLSKELSEILLEVGALLMASGANSSRIRITIMRIAKAYGFNAELLITHRALMVSVSDDEHDLFQSSLKRTSPHGANFRMVSGISRMSWRIVDEDWNFEQIWGEINRLKSLPHYPRLIVLSTVALAGASFCRLFGGGPVEMLVAFVATFIGLFVRQEVTRRNFNGYLCIFFASLASCLISGASVKLNVGTEPEYAFATSVLYLIPGIPLINSLSDLLDGNIMNGIVRGTNGLIIAFAIAFGMLCSILIYNI
ncbi:threonine/serine exporter family protein [Maribellus maritimus]|uniref:threonine/serine ThrE exporter family protein n=1 Tax=Maribellus maritimus TaxID=2870838 RepID=UPI001EEC4F53|nr:threonine/serine exporter family protein [Maribellus maritimus]MCG6190529.1 threonine/serine exporter family protein [Maribellus maritimus]